MAYLTDNNGILEVPHDPKFDPDPRGYAAHCFYKMKEFSDEIAQIDAETNNSENYGEILTKSIRTALKMKAMGVQETEVISLCTDTHSETCLPFWAAIFAGIYPANLDPSLSSSDMKHLINLVKPKLIFCNHECVENLEIVIKELNLETKLVVFGETDKHIPFKEFLKPQDGEQSFKPKFAENIFDTIAIFFSSGTTGLPKGVCVTHYGILHTIYIFKDVFCTKTVLYYTSPYWISNTLFLSATLISGGKRILSKFVVSNVLKLVQDYKVSFMFLASTFLYGVVSQPGINSNTYDTSSLHSILLGGGSTSLNLVANIKKLLPHTFANNCYGSTDISGFFSGFHPETDLELLRTKVSCAGKMVAGTMCKVVDIETNKVLGKNQRGELLIKAKRLMSGYYKNPEKTAEAFDEDGFFHTGDVVYYDEDYCFYIVDRIKEMFKYRSWHIVPTELEHILLNHPAVKEVLVIGYPDEEDGDHPMAVIVPEDGVKVSENDIMQYFNDQVSDRKKLRGGVKFVKNIPKTATGKYSRMKLRSMVLNKEI